MPRHDTNNYVNATMSSLSEKARPGITALYAALKETAEQTGFNAYQIGNIMTYFLQSIAQQVAIGKLVRIPGFGVFGAKVYWNGRRGIEPLYSYPDFVASIPFRNDVALFAPMDGANDRFLSARKKGTCRSSVMAQKGKNGRSKLDRHIVTAFKRARQEFNAQASREGLSMNVFEGLD
jgi:hypothetical protein